MTAPATAPKQRGLLFKAAMVKAMLNGTKSQTRRVVDIHQFGAPSEMHDSRGRFELCEAGWRSSAGHFNVWSDPKPCPYGSIGDIFYARETWRPFVRIGENQSGVLYRAGGEMLDERGGKLWKMATATKWRPSIFMPAWATRIRNRITGVRCERLQSITEADAVAEGIERVTSIGPMRAFGWRDYMGGMGHFDPRDSYRSLWNSINLKPSPVYERIEGKRCIIGYESFPWSNEDFDARYPGVRETGLWRGKPLTVTENCWVWVLEFQRITP